MDVERVLSTLTVDEKIRLLSGDGNWHTYGCGGKIPAIMMTDGPHGLRKVETEKLGDVNDSKPATCFPTASAVACSWDPLLAHEIAAKIAKEAKKEQISIVLGCGINMKRSPFCGRNFEYFSEDPYLAGCLATGYINGMQAEGVGTSLKHFAVNSQETRRMTSNSEVDERALREIYLKAFEMTVKNAAPTTIMASYNRINGQFATQNSHLLKDILRDEWGYCGVVISDWGATIDAVNAYKNGLNLEMPDSHGYSFEAVKHAYETGEITDSLLDELAGTILEKLSARHELSDADASADYAANNEFARLTENQCAVLLKNDGTLPVKNDRKLIIIGDLAVNMRFQGGGSSHINPVFHKSALEAFEDAGYEVFYAKGYDNNCEKTDEKLVSEALHLVKEHYDAQNSTILFFMGLTDKFEGEGYDRDDLSIPYCQIDLLERISAVAERKNIAAITFGGAPMDFSWDENTGAVLHMYLGGQAVGESVCDLVSGKANPSGKLAETMPKVRTDTPAWRYYAADYDDVEYRESIFVGYRYYETFDVPVKYPFGFGLSYTTFEYSNLHVADSFAGGTLDVSFDIKNTGNVAGAETAQIYVLPKSGNILRSKTELKGFAKVTLNPGESKTLTVTLDDDSFSVFDVSKNAFSMLSGEYDIAVGASVKDLRLVNKIVVSGNEYFRNEKELFPDYFKEQPHGMEISDSQFEALYGKKLTDFRHRRRGDYDASCSLGDVCRASAVGTIILGVMNIAVRLMYLGKKKDDPAIKMMKSGLIEGALGGLAANSGGMITSKFIDFLVLNANKKPGRAFARLFKKRFS